MLHSMRRRLFVSGSIVTVLLAFSNRENSAAEERPNIILCMGDDHGWDETGYNGHPHLKTPVLDEMAAHGLRLDRFYSAHPSCSPTRGSVITGRHPIRYGTLAPNWSIRPQEISLAKILGKVGYVCGHFGKWHLGPVKADSPTSPGAMGFDEWTSHDNFFEMNPVLSRNGGPPQKLMGEGSEVIVNETIRFIGGSQRKKQPFLAVVWFGSPHEPYSGLADDLALYDDLPASYQKRFVTLTGLETGRPVKRRFDKVLRERFAEITAMDRSIGKLRNYLDDQGLRKNTILWYCGDNGVPISGRVATPFRGQKGLVYEGGIRVPGIIEWPKRIRAPRVTDVNTVTSDMLPTICELVGQPTPDRPLDGISLKSLIDGNMSSRPHPICFWNFEAGREAKRKNAKPWIDPVLQVGTTPLVKIMDGRFTRNFRNLHHSQIAKQDYHGARSVLGNRYKLVVAGQAAGDDSVQELFDVRSDAAEKHNLIKTHPEVAAKLARQLRDWQTSVLTSLTGADYSD